MKKEIVIISLLLLIFPFVYAFDVSVKYSDVICEPNKLLCDGNDNTKVFKCGQYGDDLSVVKNCEWDEICSMDIKTNQIDCIPDYRVKGEFNKGLFIGFFISGVVILLLVIFYFLIKSTNKNKSRSRR